MGRGERRLPLAKPDLGPFTRDIAELCGAAGKKWRWIEKVDGEGRKKKGDQVEGGLAMNQRVCRRWQVAARKEEKGGEGYQGHSDRRRGLDEDSLLGGPVLMANEV